MRACPSRCWPGSPRSRTRSSRRGKRSPPRWAVISTRAELDQYETRVASHASFEPEPRRLAGFKSLDCVELTVENLEHTMSAPGPRRGPDHPARRPRRRRTARPAPSPPPRLNPSSRPSPPIPPSPTHRTGRCTHGHLRRRRQRRHAWMPITTRTPPPFTRTCRCCTSRGVPTPKSSAMWSMSPSSSGTYRRAACTWNAASR